ncbi:YcaO-like family protein [Microbacterium sp. NPDC058269]|uniref:YcaO-like family protein n=1 Tax=Microbacterium sp. NPDC058269 TaxID=3346414 RepID=UPI0036DD898E
MKTIELLDGALTIAWATDGDTGISGAGCSKDLRTAMRKAEAELSERVSLAAAERRSVAREALADDAVLIDDLAGLEGSTRWIRCSSPVLSNSGLSLQLSREWVPSEAVVIDPAMSSSGTRRDFFPTTCGTGRSDTVEGALSHGLREIFERVLIQKVWNGDLVDLEVAAPEDSTARLSAANLELAHALSRHPVSVRFLEVGFRGIVSTICAITDTTKTSTTFGAACRSSRRSAIEHSIHESLQVRLALSNLVDSGLPVAQHAKRLKEESALQWSFMDSGRATGQVEYVDHDAWSQIRLLGDLIGRKPKIVEVDRSDEFFTLKVIAPNSGVNSSERGEPMASGIHYPLL